MEQLIDTIETVIKAYTEMIPREVIQIILFGSFARGEATIYSDVDLALVREGQTPPIRGLGWELKEQIEQALMPLHRKVGWFNTSEANLAQAEELFNTNTRIKKEGIVVWKRTVT